jgi:putative flippase GtrA
VGSVASTVLSQLTLTGLFWLGGVNATTASILAFVAGAIPNFVLNWRWAWGRSGRPAVLAELAPYLAIIIGGGLAATALTTLTDHVLGPLIAERGARTIVLDIAYLSSYGLLFVIKFALMDRVFRKKPA